MKKLYMKKLGLVLLSLFTIGTMVGQKTWYVLNNATEGTGEAALVGWANPDNWTEDPAAQIFSNPGFKIPASGDNVVIKAGKEITLPSGLVVDAGAVTVDGSLHIEGPTDAHKMSALLGSGRVYINGAKLPDGDVSNFVSPGSGAGTVVLQGAGPINLSNGLEVYNLEIDMGSSEGGVFLQNDLIVNGNLNVKKGKLMVDGTKPRTLQVERNVSVQVGGHIGVTTADAFHDMIVKGDFRNYGSVKFSNDEQYAPAKNGAIRLTFEGASNNDFVINGSTELYRLFVNKGDNDFYTLSVTSNNVAHFKLMGPYAGSTGLESSVSDLEGWERLPLVIRKGTLKLGSNIKIDRLGYNRDGVGASVKEFHIPTGAALWVNGAEVQTAAESDFVNGAYANSGLSLEGRLRMSAGSFVTPNRSEGIGYNGVVSAPSEIIVEGGLIKTTQIRAFENRFLNFRQSGGIVDFYTRSGAPEKSPVFSMPYSEQVFEMSGGTMIFRVANNRGQDSHGIYIRSGIGNYNVTGGTVSIFTNNDQDFAIYSTASFYNVTVNQGTGTRPVFFSSINGMPLRFDVLNNLEIGAGSTVNAGNNSLFIGGDLTLAGTFTNNGTITLNGSSNATLTNKTLSSFTIANLDVVKSSVDAIVILSGTGSNSFSFGQVNLNRGNLDLSNESVTVTGAINLHNGSLLASGSGFATLSNGVALSSSRGKENSFGYLKLASGATVNLSSHAKAKKVDFLGNGIFNLGAYNLEIEEADYDGVSDWGPSKMFRTSGKGSDGGLTLNFTIPSGLIATHAVFPIGTTSVEYSPAVVKTTTGNSNASYGALTVVPVNSAHPSTDPSKSGDVIAYYWRTKVLGFSELENNKVRLEFTSSKDLKNLKGAFLNGLEWQVVGDNNNKYANNAKTLVFDSSTDYGPYPNLVNADYTAGLNNGEGKIPIAGVRVFRSTGNHNWHASAWKDDKGATNVGPPTASDIAIIRPEDVVTIAASNAVASQVQINGSLFVESATRAHAFDLIKGNGRLVYEYKATENNQYRIQNIINADYSEFINSPEAIVEYAGDGEYGLATVAQIPYYPNLHISGATTNVKTHRNDGSLRVKGNLVIKDAPLAVQGNDSQTIEIGQNLIIENSSFSLAAAGNTNTFIAGNIQFTGTGSLLGRNSNEVHLQGNIELGNGTINTPSEKWFLEGDMPSIISGNNAGAPNKAVFNRLIIDKKEGVEVGFEAPFTLNAAANGTTDDKPFLLKSGVARLNHADIDLTLNSGGGDFEIPATAQLIVDQGATVRASGNGSSLFLDGALVVDNGGKFLWEGTGGNHIKYSASGNASIWLGKDAKFYVGSQLFRNSEGGILNFTQASASSEVRIATIDAPMTKKGVFEVLNEGSSFTQSQENSVITVERGQSGSNPVPAIRYNPSTWSVAKGSKMIVGKAATSSSVGLYADQPMGGLDLVGATTLDVWVAPLTLNGTLNIGAGSIFNAADLDLTLKGDLLANGIFNPGINTTYFSGLVDQQITGDIAFYNLSKLDGSNSLVVDDLAKVKVLNELLVERGNVSTGSKDLMVQGNAHIALDASIDGLELNGASLQLLSGGGALGRLVINNNKNVMVPSQPDAITVNGELVLDEGVFNIGSNLLQLGKDAIITDGGRGSAFSETNMIQTFLSFTDAGVRKYFPAISSNTTFVYPIGSQNKYTPVTLNISEITSSNGYIRVKAANEPHVSILDDTETSLVEPKNVLQYYWTVDAVGIEGFRSEVSMQAYAGDVIPALEKDNYIVARIRANEDAWNKEDITNLGVAKNIYFDGTNSTLVFNGYFFEGTDDLGISGDYTAGLASAIPDKVPTVISVDTGDWNSVSTWAVYDPVTGTVGAAGEGIPQNGPLGSIVYIRENVGVSQNGRIAYRTVIESGSTLDMGATINNRLGNVSGKGRLRVENGSLPAGFYEEFATTDGGIFEYSGSGDYYVLGGINTLNSVEFTGTGSRKLPDGTLRINGNLLIDGPVVNMVETTALQIGKDLDFNSGSLELGSESKFVFNGNAPQSIGGNQPFTGENSLQQIVVDNATGVNVNNDLVINSQLQLVSGPLTPGSAGTIHLGASATAVGASANSFVNGVLSKDISGNEHFSFPVGKDNRYGAIGITDRTSTGGVWTVEYFSALPPSREDTENVAFVSNNEYWKVIAPSQGAEASATLRWDDESGINPDGFDAVSIQRAETVPLWRVVNQTSIDKNNQVVALAKLAHSTSSRERLYSFGLATMPEVGDFTWKGLESADWFNPANWYGNQVPSAGTPAIITLADVAEPAYWPIIYGNGNPVAQANDLTIDAGTSLTLDPGARLTVNGDLSIVDVGGLQIKHETGEGKMASLLTKAGVTGEANVQLTLPKEQWFYLGSSIKNSTFGVFDPSQDDQAIVNVYRDRWYGIRAKHVDTPMLPLEGVTGVYLNFDGAKEKTLSYTGELNNGEIARSYSEDRYQLFANPYPSFLNWEDVEGWERADFEGTMWFRTKVGDAMTFITYNRDAIDGAKVALYPSEDFRNEAELALIAPMQAVFVRPLGASRNLVVTNAARTHGLSNSFLKSTSRSRKGDVIRIVQDNGLSRDGAVVYFADGSSEGLDQGDSEKYKNDDAKIPEIFTRVDGQEVAINGLPVLTEAVRSIPLSVRHQETGETNLSFDLSYYYGTHNVYFEDKQTGAFLNVARNDAYSYRVNETGVQDDRFVLHFYRVTTDLETPMVGEEDAGNDISIKSIGDKVLVSVGMDMLQDGFGAVEIYTIEGRKVQEVPARSSRTLVILPGQSGVYIVRAVFGTKVKSERVLVNGK